MYKINLKIHSVSHTPGNKYSNCAIFVSYDTFLLYWVTWIIVGTFLYTAMSWVATVTIGWVWCVRTHRAVFIINPEFLCHPKYSRIFYIIPWMFVVAVVIVVVLVVSHNQLYYYNLTLKLINSHLKCFFCSNSLYNMILYSHNEFVS